MRRLTSVVLALLLLSNITAFAQVTRGSLSGNVTDQSGAAIIGATVMVKNVATGEEFRAETNSQGSFTFPSLPLGTYSASVEASGFKRTEVTNIVIEISNPAKVDIPLEVGAVTEQVTVTGANQEVINSTSPTLSNVINTRQVQDLPLLSRNPIDLARLQAGIAVTGTGVRTASIGGLRGSATNVTHDGVNAMDNFVKTDSLFVMSAPSLNATSEFSITVGTVGSDAGRGVAQVRIVTPSGTNDFHGGVFYQHRNDAFNANTFFNNATKTPKEIERQHYFGVSSSGPVWIPKIYDGRNKSFWFFSYEGFREPFSTTRNRTVLTEEARRGIFRYVGANGQVSTVNLLQIGNFGQLNPVTGAQLNAMPLPNNTLVGDALNTAGFRYNVGGKDPSDNFNGRFDQQLFDSSSLGSHKFEFVVHRTETILTPDTFNAIEAPFPGLGINAFQGSTRWLAAAAIHSTFGAYATNEARFGHQRAPVGFLREAPPDGNFFIDLGSVTDFQNRFMSQGRNTTVYQFTDNFSLVRGAHTLRFGTDIQSVTAYTFNDAGIHPIIITGSNSANPDGLLNAEFPNLPAGAAGTTIVNRARSIYADLVGLLGSASRVLNVSSPDSGFVAGATRSRVFKQRDVAFYGQDQWRMKRNFTLNYGVRWEFIGVPTLPDGLGLQITNFNDIFGPGGPNGLFQPGATGGSTVATLDFVSGESGRKLYNNDWNNFAPFIGFAWSPSFESGPLKWIFGSEGRSSIRAGYSVSYLHDGFTVISNALGVGTTNPGLIQTAANNVPTGVLTDAGVALPTPNFNVPITSLQNYNVNFNNGLWTIDPNLRTPYVQQWSFGIEREIAANTAIEARYVGNHAVKVFRATNYNEVNIFENGFLQEFLNAQANLAARGGTSFAPGAAGTVPLPILTKLFAGLAAGSGFSSSTFISNLNNNNIGAMASTLAFSSTYRTNREANFPLNFFVTNPYAGTATVLGNFSYSNYHSLQLEIRRRFSHGFQFQANYTLSKSFTDSNGSQSNLESFRSLRNLGIDYAPSDQDQRHRFVANFIYDLPFGKNRRFLSDLWSPVRKVIEGWTLGGIINWQTRPPFYINSNRSTFNSFNPGNNPAQLLGAMNFDQLKKQFGLYRTPQGVFFINPGLLNITTNPTTGSLVSATLKPGILGAPRPGTFGDFPLNSITGPRFFQTDFSLVKRTYFGETRNLEFRMTMINALNNTNFIYNGESFDDATFGLINTTSGTPRIIHFAIGFNW